MLGDTPTILLCRVVLTHNFFTTQQVKGIITFSFKNPAAMWTIDLKNGKGSVYEGKAKKRANLTLTMKTSDFVDMAEGRLNGQQAFMAGKLKMKGNMGLAMKLGNIMATVQA